MKAIIWEKYGSPDVLKLKEITKPVPSGKEVLIKVSASTVTSADCKLRSLNLPTGFKILMQLAFGITKPRKNIIGMDVSGKVEAVGKDVTLFKKGDKVFGTSGINLSANAQYICLSETDVIVKKPNQLSYKEAASITFGGLTALHFLRDKAQIKNGQKLLINGASGSVGCMGVQLAQYYGADITGVCSHSNHKLVSSLGANKVIDYTALDFTKNGKKYDVIFDTVGNLTLSKCKQSLTDNGKLILINTDLRTNLLSIIQKQLICGVAAESKEALTFLVSLVKQKVITPVIDRVYPLEEIRDAHCYVDKGHKKGNVIISIRHDQ